MMNKATSIISGNVNSSSMRRALGMTLIELMIAMTLGLLVSVGIMSAFNATSKSNKIQAGMARVQENGRYAMVRIERDLRMYGALFRSTTEQIPTDQSLSNPAVSSSQRQGSTAASRTLFPKTSIMLNSTVPFTFPDMGDATGWPPQPTVNNPQPLSFRFMGQGYDCTSAACSPTVTSSLPATGLANGSRLPGADVITVRYLRGTGWTYDWTGPTTLLLMPYNSGANAQQRYETGSDDALPIDTNLNKFAMISDCAGAQVVKFSGAGPAIQIDSIASDNLLGVSGGGSSATRNNVTASRGSCDNRFFRIPQDLVTVTYWIKLIKDPNPDAPASRLVPVLMRSENGVPEELAQGVERLDFLYAVTDNLGNVSYLNATEVNAPTATANCSYPSADLYAPGTAPVMEAGCMWRSVRGIEVHALFSTVNDMALTPMDMAYRYSIDGTTTPTAPAATSAATGLPSGKMMRREFVTYVSLRNSNF